MDTNVREREVETSLTRGNSVRQQGRFLRGPIPMRHIAKAAKLPGQCLSVYLAVHHRTALTRQRWVTLPRGLMDQLGVSRDAKSRALRELQGASLIRLDSSKGRSARISLTLDEYDNPGRQWSVTPDGLVCHQPEYFIPKAQLAERRGGGSLAMWPLQVAEKAWVDLEAFLAAFSEALMVHSPHGWRDLDLEESFQRARVIGAEAGKGGLLAPP